ncbi:MAG: hypothetical protein JXR46_10180 [Calditrichaceae bacterium]|nr:hypothetical protein [Calditrichaceae bacterium]MBN2709401.1 hypothetical protein [Calditrichaceae bacterium]RQV94444.1 MAG: hypothetical protein EH224_10435 [Calditrichota bacterium]
MNFKIKFIMCFILFVQFISGQTTPDSAYIRINFSSDLILQINDTLVIKNKESIVPVAPGLKRFALRPASNRNWYMVPLYNTVQISSGDTIDLTFDNPGFQYEVPSFKVIDLKSGMHIGKEQNGFWSNKMVKPALIASAVTANWASFYMRRQADDFYDEYKKTSDISRLNYYYDKADTYDTYATAALIVSVAATSALLYILIFDD